MPNNLRTQGQTVPAASAPGNPWDLLATVPHRFFLLAGMIQLALASLWWLAVQLARAFGWPAPPGTAPEATVHALLMIDGFLPMFMFGFAFTAGPRWLGVEAPSLSQWRPPALLAAGSAFSLGFVQLFELAATRVAAAAYALA